MGAYTDFIDQYGSDGKISKGDIKDFQSGGGSQADAQKFVEKAQQGAKGYSGTVGDKAAGYAGKDGKWDGSSSSGGQTATDTSNTSSYGGYSYNPGDFGYTDGGLAITPPMFEALAAEELAKIQGEAQVNIQETIGKNNVLVNQIMAESNKYMADSARQGTQYVADRNLDIAQYTADSEERWRKYLGDVEAENNLAVQGLKNQGAIDLQAIINTGLTDVADIQGTYASERVKLQGEYDVQRSNIQADFEKFKAARAKEGQIYGSLMAGFWS